MINERFYDDIYGKEFGFIVKIYSDLDKQLWCSEGLDETNTYYDLECGLVDALLPDFLDVKLKVIKHKKIDY